MVETGSQNNGAVQFSARYTKDSLGILVSVTTTWAFCRVERLAARYEGVIWLQISISETASTISPWGSAIYR